MPSLDRVITLGVEGPETYRDGTPIAGSITDSRVWAQQSLRRFSVLRGDQTELLTERRYRIRYRPDIEAAFRANRLSALIDGERYQVEVVVEVERRKWLDLSVFIPRS